MVSVRLRSVLLRIVPGSFVPSLSGRQPAVQSAPYQQYWQCASCDVDADLLC